VYDYFSTVRNQLQKGGVRLAALPMICWDNRFFSKYIQ
jgi:hypothetical protein